MPGTAENPVRIGPFKRIVEVGWPGNYLVVSAQIAGDVVADFEEIACSPFVPPPAGFGSRNIWMSEWNLTLDSLSVILHRKTTSEPVTGEATISGMPTPTSFTFGDYEFASGASSSGGVTMLGVKGRFEALAGDKVSLPGYNIDDTYYAVTSVNTEGICDTFTGTRTCSVSAGPYEGVSCTGHNSGLGEQPYDNASVMGDQTISFAGMSVEFRGKIFTPIGVLVFDSSGEPNANIGTVQILCESSGSVTA